MQQPQREIVTLDDILITEELSRRSPRSPNLLSENQALHTLARQLVNQPEIMLQSLVDIALELCSAGTAGVSLLEVLPSGEEIFRAHVLAGTLAQCVGGTAPRNFSPCGTCLDRGYPQLYSHPERYFTYFQEANTPIVESLVLPLIADNHALGTIWIISHDEQRHFDPEDVRVMTSLADFTAAALLFNQRQTQELLAKNAQLETEVVERKRAEESARESSACFQSIVNLVPDMLWRNDTTGDTSWYNQRWLDYTGQTMEEAQGYGWLEVIHPDDRAQSLANFQNAVDEDRPLGQEHRIRGRDGNYRWFLIQASPVYDAQGRIIQWFGAATDIHEQRTALETLRESEERLQLAADAANFGTYEYIPQTDQINWSITLKSIHGLPEDAEITFARLSELIHRDDQEQTFRKIGQFLSPDAPGPYEHEFRIVRTDGTVRWLLDKGRVFFTGEGEHRKADRAIGVTLDITNRKLREAALRESEQRLQVMIENLPGGAAFVVDRELRYLLAEGEALSAAGFKREDLVGKTIFEAMPPELTAKYEELYRMALAGESFAHEHNAHVREASPQENRFYISRGTPLRSANGEVYAVLAVSYEITERKRIEAEHQQAEAAVAADLEDTQRLWELSVRLVAVDDIQTLYQDIVATAIALTRADAGSIQILDEATQDLVLLATLGITPAMTEHFYRVNADSNTPCGMALTTGERTFVDFDVPESEDPHGSMRMHVEAGLFSAQSTPLINRSGKAIGMFSTHWRKHHRPSDRELRFLDLLARQAADLIEQRQAQEALRESEAWLAGQKEAFQAAVKGAPLETSLGVLVRTAIEQADTDVRCAFYIADDTGSELRHIAGMPDAYAECVDGFKIGADSLACGLAVYTGQPIITPDVTEDPRWQDWLWLAQQYEYRGVWSFPVETTEGKVVGTFAMYFRHPHEASPRDYEFAAVLTRAAAMIISQNQEAVQRTRAEADLRESRARLARELEDTKQLQKISSLLIEEENGEGLYEQILDVAMAIMRADFGSIQRFDAERSELHLLAWKNFHPESAAFWQTISVETGTSCGAALNHGERVIVPDARTADFLQNTETLRYYLLSGIVAVQSTPLTTREGRLVGMISTHWREVHTPDERELRLLDILTRQAADFFERRRAQNVLRQSEEKYRSLFNSIDEGFCLFEMIYDETPKTVDYRFLEVNSVFERQTGLKNVVGKLGSKIAPNTESYWLKTYDEVVKTGKPQRIENYSQSTDRWYSAYASRVGGMGSRQVCTVFSDITDRKRYEQRQAFLLQLSDALRSLSDAVEIHAAVTRIAMNFFGADRCYYCEIVDGNAIIRQDASREGLPSVAGVYPLSSFPILKTAIDAGHPFVVDDAHTTDLLDEALRQLCCELQVISFLNVPVIKAGEPTGVLCITQTTPRNWTAFETELAQETAERIWAAVERARAETSLRESEAKYRSLFTSMDEGFCLIEVLFDERGTAFDYRFLEANPAFEKQTGLVNAIGKTVRELVPQHEAQWFEIYGRIALTGVPERFENAAQELGRFYDVYAFRLGEAQERKVAVIFNDISERKRAEETQAFVLKLTDSLRPLSDPVAIQETAMQVLGTHLGVNRAFYGEVLDDDDTLAIGPGYADELSPIVGQIKFSDFDSDLLTDYRAGRTVVINDLYVDMQLSAKAKTEFDAIQVRAAVGVALLKNEKVRAILSIHQSVLRKWTEAEIALLKETADRTWAAVERARAEAALRESEIERVREQSAHEQERQRAETLVELDRAKTLFFNNVSHEFRTPLTLSLAPLQDALSDCVNPLAPPHRERLELAHRNAIRLLKLVNTLLDFSRIEAGRMEAVYEATNLALLTTELASVFHSAIERAGLQFIVDCPPLPEPVYVDREMWEKIVLNLLSNAFKFTFAGEIAVRLHPADDHHVRLQVQDTGTGIPTEELPHLFERFYQIRGAKARTHEGSGIGLALVHELIRLHGGTIDVSSTVGQGSCFTVTIPLGRAHLPNDRLRRVVGDSPTETLRERITATRTQASTAIGADPYVEEAERWLPQEEGGREGGKEGRKDIFPHSHTPTLPHSPSARVLVVDDNADMRDYLTRILSEHVEVEAVADGAAALAAAQERVPDLVLSDVMMPQMDGFELLKALRAEACTREIPIILLSARAGEESVIEGLQALADDYLIKPFSATELVTRVLAHLQMAQLRGEALRQERTTSRRKDEMLSTVSHELNTPLVAILGWTRLLRTSPLNQSMLWKSLETIERNATLQAKLISDLLDISRITAGKLHLNLEPVELQSVIEMAIATVNQSAQTKDIRLECILNPLPTTVQGDPERLQQIVLNLLTNAIKFTSKGGRIEVRLNASETHAQIVVSDTGCGISAEFLPYVFDSFRQAESSKSQSIKGLGLGLAIARHLVELHGGTIYVESPGIEQGATFTVNLPLIGVNF